jgi:hypothetical protein
MHTEATGNRQRAMRRVFIHIKAIRLKESEKSVNELITAHRTF